MAKSSILSVKITGDASSAVAALRRAETAANSFSVKNSAAFGAVAGLASKAVGAVVGYVGGLTSEMLSASDSTDKFKQTLNFAGVDNETIKRLTKDTQTYADKTVYDLKDIRDATAQLAANNVQDYDKIAKAAGNLNAVAGGTAESYGRLTTAVVQINAANKLQTQDWNQVRDAVPGASGKIKEALKSAGAYTGDFATAMSKGQISAKEFNNALMSLGLTDAAQQAAESVSTFEGATGNFEAAVVKAGTAVLDMVKPFATPILAQAADAISDLSAHINAEEITKGAQAVANFAKNEWDIVSSTIPAVGAIQSFITQNVPQFFDTASKAVKQFVDSLGVKDIQSAATATQSLTQQVASAVNYTMPFVITIGSAVTGIRSMYAIMAAGGILKWIASMSTVTTVTGAWTTAVNLARDAQAMFNLVLEANPLVLVITLIGALVAGLTYFFTQTKVGQQAWADFANFMSDVWQGITAGASAAWNWIVSGWNAAGQGIQDGWNATGNFFTGMWNGISSGASSAWQATTTWASGAWTSTVNGWNAAGNAIRGWWNSIPGFFAGIWNGIVSFASSAWNGIISGFRSVGTVLTGIANTLSAPFRAAFNAVRGFWNSTIGGKGFDVPGWIPGVGGKSFRIPMLATGGTLTTGGTVLVGERGPEFLNLPRGASVVPLNRARAAVTAGGPVINITINGAIDPESTAAAVRRALRNYDTARN